MNEIIEYLNKISKVEIYDDKNLIIFKYERLYLHFSFKDGCKQTLENLNNFLFSWNESLSGKWFNEIRGGYYNLIINHMEKESFIVHKEDSGLTKTIHDFNLNELFNLVKIAIKSYMDKSKYVDIVDKRNFKLREILN